MVLHHQPLNSRHPSKAMDAEYWKMHRSCATEACEQNVLRAHHQLAQWYNALNSDQPK